MLFEHKSAKIFRDARWLQPLSEPPGGKALCREGNLRLMASFLSDLFRTGQARNIFIFGRPGTGKTVCIQSLLREIQEHANRRKAPVSSVYVNAGRTRTPYYTMLEIVRGLGFKVPEAGWQMLRLKQAFESLLREKSVVVAIDEVDGILQKEKEPLIYYLNRQPNTTLILISNKIEDAAQLPERLLSTLRPKFVKFDPYTPEEAKAILLDRVRHAFQPDAISEELLSKVAEKASAAGDIRYGFSVLLSAGSLAERDGRARITEEDIRIAIEGERATEILGVIGDMKKLLGKRHHGREFIF